MSQQLGFQSNNQTRQIEKVNVKDKSNKTEKLNNESRSKGMPEKPTGKYSDGHPRDKVQYLECKLILKGDRVTAESNFDDFAKVVKRAAENSNVDFSCKEFKDATPQELSGV